MNAPKHQAVCLWILVFLGVAPGCSLLGFSAYPTAHLMTDDTRRVLEQSSTRFNVARELSKEVHPMHYLQPGDELLLEVVEFDSDVRLPADQQVMVDGTIDLGKYGRVVVASKTPEQAEAIVQRAIADVESKEVTVNVRLLQPVHRYYVIGEVNSPGAYPLAGHETVLDAILEAGGLTTRASACDLLLARPTDPRSCRVTLPVCYRAITQLGDTTTNYHLKPGDRIFVGRQSICEEMFSCCRGPKTCDRCCACQRACRDPNAVPSGQPEFIPPAFERIPAELPPAIPELEESLPPAEGEVEVEVEPVPPGMLDGELEF